MPEVAVTTVRIPKDLQKEFSELPSKNWLNFSDFTREAIREKLNRERLRALRGIEEREEPGPLRPPREKPSS